MVSGITVLTSGVEEGLRRNVLLPLNSAVID